MKTLVITVRKIDWLGNTTVGVENEVDTRCSKRMNNHNSKGMQTLLLFVGKVIIVTRVVWNSETMEKEKNRWVKGQSEQLQSVIDTPCAKVLNTNLLLRGKSRSDANGKSGEQLF